MADNYNAEAIEDDGTCTYPEPTIVYGCRDPTADNYNSEATEDDGSCSYTIAGCMDPVANNYNPEATEEDGSCLPAEVPITVGTEEGTYPDPVVLGCTDQNAMNYVPEATEDDGTCEYEIVKGRENNNQEGLV